MSAGDCDFQVSDAPLHARQPLFACSLLLPCCARSPARRASRKLLERIVEFIRLLDCGDKIVEYNQEQCRLKSFRGKTSLVRSFPSKVRKLEFLSQTLPKKPSSFYTHVVLSCTVCAQVSVCFAVAILEPDSPCNRTSNPRLPHAGKHRGHKHIQTHTSILAISKTRTHLVHASYSTVHVH